MNKRAFLAELQKGLSGLPQKDIEERLTFYREMIDDRMEEGLSEEEAVEEFGNVSEIIAQIIADSSFDRSVKQKTNSVKKLKAWEIVLLILGSPVWLSLAVVALAVIISLYVVLWAMIISLWAVFVSLAAGILGGTAAGLAFTLNGHALSGIAMIGAGIVCAGVTIFAFFGCKAATKGTLFLTKVCASGIKGCFVKKEEA